MEDKEILFIRALESNDLDLFNQAVAQGLKLNESLHIAGERSAGETQSLLDWALEYFATNLLAPLAGEKTISELMKIPKALSGLIRYLNIQNLTFYLKNGGDIYAEENGKGLLHYAIHFAYGNSIAIDTIDYILSQGYDINKKSYLFPDSPSSKASPLMMALNFGLIHIAEKFLKLNASLDRQADLDFAIENKFPQDSVRFLFDHGCASNKNSPWAKNVTGDIDFYSVREGKGSITKFLKNGGHINHLFDDIALGKTTLLHEAAFSNKVDIIEFLLEKGANINALDGNGKTPLDLIAHRGNQATQALKKAGGLRTNKKS